MPGGVSEVHGFGGMRGAIWLLEIGYLSVPSDTP